MSQRVAVDDRRRPRENPLLRQSAPRQELWRIGEVLPQVIARYGVPERSRTDDSWERAAPRSSERADRQCA